MAKSTDEVYVGVDGVVSIAPLNTGTAPISATSVLAAPWVDYGYVSEDGVTETTDTSSDKIRAWQKAKVVRTVISDGTISWKLVLIQTSAETVALYYGGTVLSNGSIILDPTRERPRIGLVLDVIDGDNIIRTYAPEAQVSEVGDQVYQNGAAIGYEVTIEAEYNEDLGGSAVKYYSALAPAVVATITTALPTAKTTGDVVTIVGAGLDGALSITVGGVNAPAFDIVSATKMYVTLPAGSAGSAPIIVTTSAGASTPKAYTRA